MSLPGWTPPRSWMRMSSLAGKRNLAPTVTNIDEHSKVALGTRFPPSYRRSLVLSRDLCLFANRSVFGPQRYLSRYCANCAVRHYSSNRCCRDADSVRHGHRYFVQSRFCVSGGRKQPKAYRYFQYGVRCGHGDLDNELCSSIPPTGRPPSRHKSRKTSSNKNSKRLKRCG